MSPFFVEFFLSPSAKKHCRRTLLSCVSESFWERISLWTRRTGGEYQDILPKTFCLTVAKKFVGEPSRVSLISRIEKYRKMLCLGGLCHDLLSIFFCLAVQKFFAGEASVLCFGKLTVANNFVDEQNGGEYQNFCRKHFVSQCRKIS